MSVSQPGSPTPKARHPQQTLRIEGRYRVGRFAVSLIAVALLVVAALVLASPGSAT